MRFPETSLVQREKEPNKGRSLFASGTSIHSFDVTMVRPNNTEIKNAKKCGERGSNTRPSDLQSDALPTELSPLCFIALNCLFIICLV
jgi:hypothetical protein